MESWSCLWSQKKTFKEFYILNEKRKKERKKERIVLYSERCDKKVEIFAFSLSTTIEVITARDKYVCFTFISLSFCLSVLFSLSCQPSYYIWRCVAPFVLSFYLFIPSLKLSFSAYLFDYSSVCLTFLDLKTSI